MENNIKYKDLFVRKNTNLIKILYLVLLILNNYDVFLTLYVKSGNGQN